MPSLIPDAAAFERRLAGLPVVKHPADQVILAAGSKTGRLFFLRSGAVEVPVQVESVKKVLGSLNIQLVTLEVRRPSDFEEAFSAATQRRADAMLMLSSPLISANVQMLAELSVRHHLPAITLFPDFARKGGFMAYGPNLLGLYRRVGVLAGNVLRGANPADLPIERPTKFELVLNLRTADALGLSIPASLLLRADEVIE
jgi:putative tryptophan/tyrosine transport system substrate-binding protein